jgi:CHRD domain/PEP-CTERM motif
MKTWFALTALALATAAQAHTTQFTGTFVTEGGGGRTGSGSLFMEYDEHGRTLLIDATFQGLSGVTTQSHIHCCTAAVGTGNAGVALAQQPTNNLLNFPIGVSSAHYLQIIDLASTSSYTATFLTASGGTTLLAEERLIANLTSQQAYLNIHTSTFTGGEIRALVTAVPEPSAWAMMAFGVAGLGALARRRA